jgi:hypothetical protein
MSTWQGLCGTCNSTGCATAPVLPTENAQLSSGGRTALLSDTNVFVHAVRAQAQKGTSSPTFKSAAAYMQYKKAQILVSPNAVSYKNARPPISSLVVGVGCQPS